MSAAASRRGLRDLERGLRGDAVLLELRLLDGRLVGERLRGLLLPKRLGVDRFGSLGRLGHRAEAVEQGVGGLGLAEEVRGQVAAAGLAELGEKLVGLLAGGVRLGLRRIRLLLVLLGDERLLVVGVLRLLVFDSGRLGDRLGLLDLRLETHELGLDRGDLLLGGGLAGLRVLDVLPGRDSRRAPWGLRSRRAPPVR